MAKILFTADLHGNATQYKKVFKKAEKENIDILIFGGDLAPKDEKNRNINDQKKFLKLTLLNYTKKHFQKTGNKTYIILGNDDFRANQAYLEAESESQKFEIFHNKVLSVNNINLIGYGFVNITPFKYKDWEKADLNDVHESTYLNNFITEGKTTENGWVENKKIDLTDRNDSIENDLNVLFNKTSEKVTILISHCPPFDTIADKISNGDHVGSKAIKKAILKFQPNYSLHGHIHETVELTGKYSYNLGATVIMTPGNSHLTNDVAVIMIDTDSNNYTREII